MSDPQETLSNVLAELGRLKAAITRHRARQVTNLDDRDLLKSVSYAWFRSYRTTLNAHSPLDFTQIDFAFQAILEATDRATTKSAYLSSIREATLQVRALRASYLVPTAPSVSSDSPPDFTPLAADQVMRDILIGRWDECQKCLKGGAHLAATVMMGGLLEALFLARAGAMKDKAPLFKAKLTPIDPKTKTPIPLKDWTLRPYIDVGHEIGWITKSGKDIAVVLRDYRNIVHPEKQRSLGIALNDHDSGMFWEITKSLSRQLLSSV